MDKNSKFNNQVIKKALYLVSTPIGNLGDITLRAIEILRNSDYILCEDTRISKTLLLKYNIKSRLISNHKFNEVKNITKVINLLKSGSTISLISDAGTPCISDPGLVLINKCVENDLEIISIPGPSSVISAISISGFSEKFFFYGFFPEKKKILENDLENLSGLESSIVFFIPPKKIKKSIPTLKKYFSGRKVLICREMTKYYEEFFRTEVDKLDETNFELKGEFTFVISGLKPKKKGSQTLGESDKRIIDKMINKLTVKEIVDLVNLDNKKSKKEIYNYCIKLKNEK